MSDAVPQSSDDPLEPMTGEMALGTNHASRARVFPLTDLGNAERLVTHYGRDLHYVYAWNRWLIYNGQRWCEDRTGQIMDLAAKTARRIRAEAFQAADNELREALLSWARASEAYARLRAMVSLAQSQAGIPITTDELDADDRLLNCANGVIDLHTGRLRPHQRNDLLTKQLPVPYDPLAKCPEFHAFLHTIFDASEDLIAFIQRAIGYSLTGVVAEHALFFLHGRGQNGKSTFCEVFAALLGAHFQKAPASLLMTKDGARLGGASPHIARLFRARMVVAAEISQDHRLNEAQVKDLTGGDTIAARHLFQGYFEFRPTHKLWLYGNHRPLIRGTDEGIWRRIHLIPFTVQIPREEQDPFFLRDRLLPELPGILAWAVQGCLAWQRDGLGVPREVREATDAYRAHMDHIQRFLNDCCVIAPHFSAAVKELYTAYMTWCDETGEETLGKGAFTTALEDRGFQKHKGGKGGRFRRGLALSSGRLLHATSPTDSAGADFQQFVQER